MALLHKTSACVLLLLCLHLPGLLCAPPTLQEQLNDQGRSAEVRASLEAETHSEGFLQVTPPGKEVSEAPVTEDASTTHLLEDITQTNQHGDEESYKSPMNLKENMTKDESDKESLLVLPISLKENMTKDENDKESLLQHPMNLKENMTKDESDKESLLVLPKHLKENMTKDESDKESLLVLPKHLKENMTRDESDRESLLVLPKHLKENMTKDESDKESLLVLPKHLKENMTRDKSDRESLLVHPISLKENKTEGESEDDKDDARTPQDIEDNKPGIQQQQQQQEVTEKVMKSSGWFMDTLNVTTRPVVIWSRHAHDHAHDHAHRPSPLTTEDEDKEEEVEDEVHLTVKFMKEDHLLILDLHPTRDLLAASYGAPSSGDEGDNTLVEETRAMPCEYQGVVRGQQQTWVALSVCDGLSGVVAVTLEGGEEVELLVEPSSGSTSLQEPHRVFSSALLHLPNTTCGVKDTYSKAGVKHDLRNATTHDHRTTNDSTALHRRTRRWVGLVGEALWFKKNTRFVELVLVADYSFYIKHGARTYSRCKTIVNIVNAVYRSLGIVVVLSHLEVWNRGDKIRVTSDFEENLNLFKKYRREMLDKNPQYNNDNTMLITNVDFRGSTVGYAVVNGMCGTESSCGVVQDKREHPGVVAHTLTHEMGHNFGMAHDGDEENRGTCHCATSACIMSSTSSSTFKPRASWSSCSKNIIQNKIDSESYQCLTNVPTRMYPRSSCGDGVVDYGEECDCGPSEFCDNPCCVATTCRFAVNASCASGPCCDTKRCEFKPKGVACREVITECDVPEFCSGSSELCPEDVTKLDGTPCFRGQGQCYEGRCSSHDKWCQVIWGERARASEDACFTKLNTRGGTNGNCGFKGHTKTHLLPCDQRDTLCGTLHCHTEPGAKPKVKISANYAPFHLPPYTCNYIVSSKTLASKYWLTPDGAKCGQGKMCLNQKCVEIPKPSGECRGGCSGHGVCNSRHHCHCDPGYAPPHCSEKGKGGSVDSNRNGPALYKDPLWEAVFILSLILLGAVIVLCCLWSHVRRCWDARGRAATPPCCARCLDACCCAPMSLITDRLCTRKRKEDVPKETQNAWEKDKMICQVDVNLKNNELHTNSWGVANKRLVTDVVTMTPKNSPDFRRKIKLPSHHNVHQTQETEGVDHPTYIHSVSVDSGCISDVEETTVDEPCNSRVSMNSLASLFKKFGTQSSPSPRMPLRRMVVDPLVGGGRSRHGTPPPDDSRHDWRRSVSQEEQSMHATARPDGPPPPPPPVSQKPHSNKSPQVCRTKNNIQGAHVPRSNTPPTPSPLSTPRPPPLPPSHTRKPKMPPGKKQTAITIKTQSRTQVTTNINAVQQKDTIPMTSTPWRPAVPSGRGPEGGRPPKLPPGAPSKPADLPPTTTRGRVKDLAKKLEQQ